MTEGTTAAHSLISLSLQASIKATLTQQVNNVTNQAIAAEYESREPAHLSLASRLQNPALKLTPDLESAPNFQSDAVQLVFHSRKSRRFQKMASTRNGRNTGYNVSSNLNWKTLPRLEIRLDGFPKHFTTWDIYHMVEAFGNIVHVSIKDPRWERARHALVKFQ